MSDAARLPDHIEPMLARIGEPFDADDHVFEVKWDGVRAIAYVEGGALRMHGRRRRDLAGRYPELAFLAGLPDGTVLDGELVVRLPDGRCDFRAILSRENASGARVATAALRHRVDYVVFDLLYVGHRALLAEPLAVRRERLAELVRSVGADHLVFSDGIVGRGRDLFEAVAARGVEGIVGKRLDAPYCPGERSAAWQKIKRVQVVLCLVLGYEPDGQDDFKSLIVASDFDGRLQCVGKVGSGIDEATHRRLRTELLARPAKSPLIATELRGHWVTPGLYCRVSFLERTVSGSLRAPVFLGMVEEGES